MRLRRNYQCKIFCALRFMDARVKPGHDTECVTAARSAMRTHLFLLAAMIVRALRHFHPRKSEGMGPARRHILVGALASTARFVPGGSPGAAPVQVYETRPEEPHPIPLK